MLLKDKMGAKEPQEFAKSFSRFSKKRYFAVFSFALTAQLQNAKSISHSRERKLFYYMESLFNKGEDDVEGNDKTQERKRRNFFLSAAILRRKFLAKLKATSKQGKRL